MTSLINYLKDKFSGKESAPEGVCPNCWGKQEYEGKFLEKVAEQRIDTNNLSEHTGWVNEYAVRNFEGIRLKKTDDYTECPTCKLTYRPH